MKRLCTLLLAALLCFSISGTTLAAEITDVPEDAAYSDAVRWTVEQGIISPGADGMPSVPEASALAGANDGTYYTHAVAWADHLGLLDDAFDPNAPVTRAGIATCLHLKSMPRMTEDTPLASAGQLVISRQPQSMEPSGGMVTFKVEASGGKAPYT